MSQYQTEKLLNQLEKDVKEIVDFANNELKKLTSKELNTKPQADKWSIAECLEHLNIYSRYYLEVVDRQMKISLQKGVMPQAIFKSSWLGKMSINSVLPENLQPTKTMKRFNPSFSGVGDNVLEEFMEHQEILLKLIKEARNVNLSKVKISIEFARFLKLQLGDCLLFLVAHEQRHTGQMKRVLAVGELV